MDTLPDIRPAPTRLDGERPICLAILAMGGQGGGVLADWIVSVAEASGFVAQSTSVPGVAQRTGATIYYIEMLKPQPGRAPVLALTPTPGDVDVVLAAEFMEAGRSMLRGLVTPERTVLIASSHRALAVSEKEVPGDGIGDPLIVEEAAGVAARRIVAFDMQNLAERNGSVISATMFGALAASGVLPFERSAFEAAIRAGGKGVEPSLRAFGAGFDRVGRPEAEPALPPAPVATQPATHPMLDGLRSRIAAFPAVVQPMLRAGVERLVDYLDPAYATEYLDRIETLYRLDLANGGATGGFAFTTTAAKYLAVAMAYDDVIRVADLKTRGSRFDRVRQEVGVGEDQLLYMTEFMHPRGEEVVGTLPRGLGHWIEARPALFRGLDRLVNRGRRVRTGTIGWFLALYLLAGMARWRRGTLRHGREMAHIAHWLDVAVATLPRDYDLAVEALACRRLVKGYSDTHARGLSKFDRVLAMVPRLTARPDGAAWLRRLREAALADEEGLALDGALKTAISAYEPT